MKNSLLVPSRLHAALSIFLCGTATLPAIAQLQIPGNTGYVQPNPYGAKVGKEGIRDWRGLEQSLLWGGELMKAGELTVTMSVRLAEGKTSKLRLAVDGKTKECEFRGTGQSTEAAFGSFAIAQPGYVRLELASLNATNADNGEILALTLGGPASEGAHFNLKPRRNAASIHLGYDAPEKEGIEWFYAEAVGVEDPLHTFYMAAGFSRGYFGMQVNHPNERRIIFSVWDAGEGQSADHRKDVKEENHTQLIAKGEGVQASVFGGEGTGGHSHLKYLWKTGSAQKFAVRAQTEGTFTTYSGYWFHPEKNAWMLIASFKAPKDGKALRGLHSFVENFGGETGQLRRKATYTNLWARTQAGKWYPLDKAWFSHDPTGKSDRLDRLGGVEGGSFFLANGGFVAGTMKYGHRLQRDLDPAAKPPLLPE
jgi:hypothetical protein